MCRQSQNLRTDNGKDVADRTEDDHNGKAEDRDRGDPVTGTIQSLRFKYASMDINDLLMYGIIIIDITIIPINLLPIFMAGCACSIVAVTGFT